MLSRVTCLVFFSPIGATRAESFESNSIAEILKSFSKTFISSAEVSLTEATTQGIAGLKSPSIFLLKRPNRNSL